MKRTKIVSSQSFVIRLFYDNSLFDSSFDFDSFSTYILKNTSADATEFFHDVMVEFIVYDITPSIIENYKEELTKSYEKYVGIN